MHTHEQAQRRQRYQAHLPWWRKPHVGYLLALPLPVLSALVLRLLAQASMDSVIAGIPDFLVTVLIAWIWGTGEAIATNISGVLSLDVLFPPSHESSILEIHEILPLVPLLLALIVVALIATRREAARRKARLAQQELQERTRELEQANQTKDRFLSLTSHELKTPITLISTQVQFGLRRLAKQKEVPPEAAALKELLEQVNQQTCHLQGLIKDGLDLSLLGGKQMPLRIERCDLSAKCREIIEELRASSGRSIVLQSPPTPIIIDADCERIGQIIINLVINAIKYSPQASTILSSISQSNSEVIIQVHNDGQAIPTEQQERLFEPYYRAPNAQASPEEGSGLGLAISKEIVERHQGRIWVESSQEKGTTFFVQLPLKASA